MCALCTALASCRGEPPPATREVITYKEVGKWTGRGDRQTETFTGDTGGFRVTWELKNEDAPGAGRLKVVFRSGDSGRDIMEALDVRGAGTDVAYVAAERPRWYFLTIESAHAEWSVKVDEEIRGRESFSPRR